jgi:hypothetical protein
MHFGEISSEVYYLSGVNHACFGHLTVVKGVAFVRRMRGDTRAELWRGDDGRHWVVKRIDNPQGRRILVNETLSHLIIIKLGLRTPSIGVVSLPEKHAGPAQLHFGSLCPGSCKLMSVYDFLPDAFLRELNQSRSLFRRSGL